MPFIAGRHDGRALYVDIRIIDAAVYAEYRRSEQILLQRGPRFTGLIDTGATTTMITSNVVNTLSLVPIDRIAYHGLGGSMWVMGYLFHLAFYDGTVYVEDQIADQTNPADRLRVFSKTINGGEITSEPSFDVQIGMDVISTGTLTVRRDGTFIFEF